MPEPLDMMLLRMRPFLIARFAIGIVPLVSFVRSPSAEADEPASPFAEILVVDDSTNRGIPLVELTTVNSVRFVTDNAGRIALNEPGWMDSTVFFDVHSHGYEIPTDALGIRGVKLHLASGTASVIRLKRRNIAERLYRITGEGLYRDTVLLGKQTPLIEPLGVGKVAGQDSAFSVPYREKFYWFWGDTTRMSYPLGHFWMGGATSQPPKLGGLPPSRGINLKYFVDEQGFSRPMCRLGVKHGLIWADGFATVIDENNRERLVCHYAHMESLQTMLGHGLAIYNDDREKFETLAEFDLSERWRWPAQSHPIRRRLDDTEYLLLGEVYPTVRVPARLQDFTNLDRYEAWSCLLPSSTPDNPQVDRDENGMLRWRWRRDALPVDPAREHQLIKAELLKPEEARGRPVDVDSGNRVRLHRGSVNWNPYRDRWIMITCQQGGTSNLGEIWYLEATDPTGPWRFAKKIVTHDQYSFYNPVHHAHFDEDRGRIIYFEGTYTTTFSGNQQKTARYDYNQMMYRLDLSDPRFHFLN